MGFWNDDDWLKAGQSVVVPFDPEQIDDAKYRLKVGAQVYITTGAKDNTARSLRNDEYFTINPGEFAFLITEERVNIPLSCLGFISMTTKIKFFGLVNVSGFHVDPGYSGKLIFSVFNAGPKKIHLQRGRPIFSLWLAALNQPNSGEPPEPGYENIRPDIVNQIEGEFVTAYQLTEQIGELKIRISTVEDNWRALKPWTVAFVIVVIILLRGPIVDLFGFINPKHDENPPAAAETIDPIGDNSNGRRGE